MSARRVIVLVLGVLIATAGFAALAVGGALLWANETQRDADGYFTTRTERLAGGGRALASDRVDLGVDRGPGWTGDLGDIARVRVRASSADPRDEIFVGIAPAERADRYLADVAHTMVDEVGFHPFRVRYEDRPGTRTPAAPASAGIWVASDQGTGRREVVWPLREGRWVLVIMNADASPGVAADVTIGIAFDPLGAVAVGFLIAGFVVLAIGALLVVLALRPRDGPPAAAGAAPAGAAAALVVSGPYPLALRGDPQPDLSRWLWLVKWVLLIPHFLILAVLWAVFTVLTVVAFFAIAFTGRYPRGIFDVNVGILRWTWRVGFYGYSALGSDRYPPFTLGPSDHPAQLEVAHPERLSRGLVWVKWWLLALPHLIIVAILGTGVWWSAAWAGSGGWDDPGWQGWGGGLVGVLVFVAGLWLLFAGRYPRGLFDLIMGLNRWGYRVVAYVGLMTDVYPPFRLDAGPREPVGREQDHAEPPGGA